MQNQDNQAKNPAGAGIAIGMGTGIAIGVGLGIALDNLAMGIGLGIAFGGVYSFVFNAVQAKKKMTTAKNKKSWGG